MTTLNTSQLELLTWLGKVFTSGITPNWIRSLANGECYLFDEHGIISISNQDGFVVINSGTTKSKFTVEMLRFIKNVIVSNENVIISHNGTGIRGIEKYGFTYNDDMKAYIKGDI